MTVSNASSASETLTVMLVFALMGIPFVLLYTAAVQYLFRGKVRLTDESYGAWIRAKGVGREQ
jgi:cytochrome bd ubiquinol oxidase subunit II